MNALRLYLRYAGVSVRGQMQYRTSFVLTSLGLCVVTVTELLGIFVLFHRFGALRGWRLEEIGLFYGLTYTSFALAAAFGRGFDTFPGLVRGGGFDRILLRPRSAAFQVASGQLLLNRVGRLGVALAVLFWAAGALDVRWTLARAALLAFAVAGGVCLFYGLFELQATLAFWTVETLEIMNTVTDGGRETAQYPLSIYRPWFRTFFTFVVPLACVSYFPAVAALGRRDEALGSPAWFQCAAPLVGVAFLVGALAIWRIGVRHYRSTGS